MSSPRLERLGLVALDVEERDGFVGISVPPPARGIADDAVKASLLRGIDLRLAISTPPSSVSIIAVLADPFPPAPRSLAVRVAPRRVDDVLEALEARQPKSHRVGPEWHTDRRAVRALDDALRRSTTVMPVSDDEAPLTEDAPALEVARTERAMWPQEPKPLPAPEARPFETTDAGRLHALGAWPVVLLHLLWSPSPMSRDSVRVAAERFEHVGDERRALIAWAALGDDAARERVLGVPNAPSFEPRPVAAFASTEDSPRRERLREIVEWEASGRRLEAAAALEALAVEEGDGRIAEIAATLRASLALPRAFAVEVNREEHWLVLGDAPTLGRVHADVIVPGSLVSRRHLRFRLASGVPIVEDLGSHNGTLVEGGGPLTGALPVTAEVRLLLGGKVPCVISPHRFGVALDAAGARRLLTLGPLAVGGLTLEAAPAVVLSTGEGTLDGAPFSGPIELAIGDRVRAIDGIEIRVLPISSRAR